jgi:hypothetical protein
MSDGPTVQPGQILTGSSSASRCASETVQASGPTSWVVGLVGTQSERFRKVTLTSGDLDRLTILDPRHSYDGDGRLLRLGLQAYALGIAYEFDPYFRALDLARGPAAEWAEDLESCVHAEARINTGPARSLVPDSSRAGRAPEPQEGLPMMDQQPHSLVADDLDIPAAPAGQVGPGHGLPQAVRAPQEDRAVRLLRVLAHQLWRAPADAVSRRNDASRWGDGRGHLLLPGPPSLMRYPGARRSR